MKYYLYALVALMLFSSTASAQKSLATMTGQPDPSSITGGLGLTWINGQAYYLISVAPDLAFGKFGVGLDINLLVSSSDNKIRRVGFDSTAYDYVRMIRYLRWGHKGDDVYARLGVLDYSQLGHGFIMYLYNNSPSYDDRRLGTEFDLNFGKYGFGNRLQRFCAAGGRRLEGARKSSPIHDSRQRTGDRKDGIRCDMGRRSAPRLQRYRLHSCERRAYSVE